LTAFYTNNLAIADISPMFLEASKVAEDFDKKLTELLAKASEQFAEFLKTVKEIHKYSQTKTTYVT